MKAHVLALLVSVCALVGCSSGGSTTKTPDEPPVVKKPIPADSPFAKIKEGMGSDEVFATIGQPTSQSTYETGKRWIPFHYGGDNMRTTAHYKGVGTITFSQDHSFTSRMSVIEVDYNPDEPGFERKG